MHNRSTEIVAGLAVFFSMSYVAFATPLILNQAGQAGAGMPVAPVFFATCLMAAVASLVSGLYARTPAALASGLALSSAMAQFLQFRETTITWENAMVVSAIAGVFLLIASLVGFRRKVVDSIPQSIKLAVIGGIGAVLAEGALKLVREHPGQFTHNLVLFVIGLAVIALGYIVLRSVAVNIGSSALDLLGRSSLFLSVVMVAALAYSPQSVSLNAAGGQIGDLWLWSHAKQSLPEAVQGALKWESIVLLFFILYILFADIVGSPYHMALDEHRYKIASFTPGEEVTIRRSFVVDSIANLAAPVVGTSPVVYYAENFAGRVLGGRTPIVAYVTAAGFFLLFIVGLALGYMGKSISVLIPGISVAPALFFVGIMIISKALWSGEEESTEPQPQDASPLAEFRDLGRRLPAAISVVATPVAGFDIGVGAGILSYFVLHYLIPKAAGAGDAATRESGALIWLALVAAISMFIKAKLSFG